MKTHYARSSVFRGPGALATALGICVACAEATDSEPVEHGSGGSGGAMSGRGGSFAKGAGGSVSGGGFSSVGGTAMGGKSGQGGSSAGGGAGTGAGGGGGMQAPVGCVATAEGGAGGDSAGGASGDPAGTSGAAGVGTLFFDDFEDGDAEGWMPWFEGWAVTTSIDGGVYRQGSDELPNISWVPGSCWADQVVEARVRISDYPSGSALSAAELYARFVSTGTHYFLAVGADSKLRMGKRVNAFNLNTPTQIGNEAAIPFDEGVWFDVRLEVVGTTLRAYVGPTLQIEVTDAAISSGGVGVGAVDAVAEFDDVRVRIP